MIVQIIETTDDKYIGLIADTDRPMVSPDGITFHPTKVQDLGNGLYRFSNSNYIIEAKDITHG